MDTFRAQYAWILVLLLFVAPLVALWWLVRRVRRWWQARVQAKAAAAQAAASGQAQDDSAHGYSFPLGIPIVVCPLLLIATVRGAGKWWGYAAHAVYFVLMAAFLWMAFSRAQFDKIRANDPSLTRATWLLNWLLFFVLLPLAAWIVFGLSFLCG
jgi:hypothetical protein